MFSNEFSYAEIRERNRQLGRKRLGCFLSLAEAEKKVNIMLPRPLEASRRLPIPVDPYPLEPEHLPFGFLFVRTNEAGRRDTKDEAGAIHAEATSSNPETSGSDSNDPRNDEEIDWLRDD